MPRNAMCASYRAPCALLRTLHCSDCTLCFVVCLYNRVVPLPRLDSLRSTTAKASRQIEMLTKVEHPTTNGSLLQDICKRPGHRRVETVARRFVSLLFALCVSRFFLLPGSRCAPRLSLVPSLRVSLTVIELCSLPLSRPDDLRRALHDNSRIGEKRREAKVRWNANGADGCPDELFAELRALHSSTGGI